MVTPAGADTPLPAVLVIHENRGLNPYIKDVARRLGKAGFIALAPDGLTPLGGYPGTDDEGREMQRQLDTEKLMNDFFAGFEYLNGRDDTTKIGAVGFCYGGGVGKRHRGGLPGCLRPACRSTAASRTPPRCRRSRPR